MKVKRKELKAVLEALRPGLAKRETVQQMCHFIFIDGQAVTYNEKVCVAHPFESDFNFSVKGEEFYNIIDGIPEDEIEIKLTNGSLKVQSKSTKCSISTLAIEEDKLQPVLEEVFDSMGDWKKLPKDFVEAATLCSFSASVDLLKAIKACVYIKNDVCYSTDDARASTYKMSKGVGKDVVLRVLARDIAEIVKFPITKYCSTEKWVHFMTDNDVSFSSAVMGNPEDFPAKRIDEIMAEKEKEGTSVDLPTELKDVMDSIIIMGTESTVLRAGRIVDIDIEKGKLLLKTSNDLGWIERTLPVKYDGEPIKLRIASKFFKEILQRATTLTYTPFALYFESGPFLHALRQAGSR